MDIKSLLAEARDSDASDLHIIAGHPPLRRVDGKLLPAPGAEPLSPANTEQALASLTTEAEHKEFAVSKELDFGFSLPGNGRYRCNAARQQGTVSLVIRLLPLEVPSLDELGLPGICRELVLRKRGMVVVSGPTGSGKSTTLAAMINYLNSQGNHRLVTVEDPVEYIYKGGAGVVTQRELGSDTVSFASALKHVLRQDPDVILIGEMRDLETASAALTIAETGHLVLTTGHATGAAQAVDRIVDLFPPHERQTAQSRMASLLLGIICQTLVPKASGSGRVAAVEVMIANNAVRNLIREGKTFQLANTIRTQREQGMQLLDQALIDLHRRGEISREDALAFSNDPDEVARMTSNNTGK
jgi:twitching motility protein PilT